MKKVVIFFIIIAFLGGVSFLFLNKSNQATGNTQLSERSKEYLTKQQAGASSDWRTVSFDQKRAGEQMTPQVIKVGTCLRLDVPFPITATKHMGECFEQLAIDLPRGIINVYTKKVGYASVADDPGVRARRLDTKTYQEEKKVINGREFIIFQKKDAGYEKSALSLNQGTLFSLNLLSTSNEDLDVKFLKMLSSVKFEEK